METLTGASEMLIAIPLRSKLSVSI